MQDAPMAGGLATTSTIVRADFWRLGQCRPGDSLRFKRISWASAKILRERTEAYLAAARRHLEDGTAIDLVDTRLPEDWSETVLHRIDSPIEVVFRQSGDSYLHVTYGPMTASALTRAHIQYRIDKLKEYKDIVAIITATRCEHGGRPS
jgi:urea carboxylase